MCYRCLTADSGRNRSTWRQGAAAVTVEKRPVTLPARAGTCCQPDVRWIAGGLAHAEPVITHVKLNGCERSRATPAQWLDVRGRVSGICPLGRPDVVH